MKRNIFTVIIILFTVPVFSQTVTEMRRIKTTALEIYEKYVSIMANLYNGDVYNEDKFLELFYTNALIYNDILPQNNPQQLSPKQYLDKFIETLKMNYTEYHDFDFDFPTSKNNKWEIKCTFSKDIRFKTKIDNYYPKWSFNYILTIQMDNNYNQTTKVYENAKIKSIEVREPLTDFFIVENKNNIELLYKSDNLKYFEGENNSRMFSSNEMKVKDIKINIPESKSYFNPIEKFWVQKKDDEHIYMPEFQYQKKNLAGFAINYCPTGFGYKINSENFNDIKLRINELSLSFLYGKQLSNKNQNTWFLNLGLDANWNFLKYTGTYYTEYQSVDSDNDPYLRKIKINSLNEKINNLGFSLPLSIEYVIQLEKITRNTFFLSFEIGAFASYLLLSQNNYSLNVDYHGLYNYFGGVEFDHYYDYGNFDISGKQNLASINDFCYDYGAFSTIGFWVALDKSNLLKLDFSYKHSFNTPLKYKDNYVISKDYNSYQSLLQSTKQGVQNLYVGISWMKTINTKMK